MTGPHDRKLMAEHSEAAMGQLSLAGNLTQIVPPSATFLQSGSRGCVPADV
jgi:hypothetical protein